MFRTLLLAGLVLACVSVPFVPAREEDKPKKDGDNPAAKPIERLKQGGWKARHDKFLNQTKKGGIEVAFLGDSITQGWEGQKAIWTTAFGPFKAGNYGISGDQTGHVLWRITEGKELDGLKLKAAVIMIGTNNTGGHSAEQIAGGIEAIVKELRKQQPEAKILLLGVFPRANGIPKEDEDGGEGQAAHKKIGQINAIISKLDDGKHVFYKDIGGKYMDSEAALPRRRCTTSCT